MKHAVCFKIVWLKTGQVKLYWIFKHQKYWPSVGFFWVLLSHFSHVWLCIPGDCSVCQASPTAFSRQEYWSAAAAASSWDLPNTRIELRLSCVSTFAGGFFTHWIHLVLYGSIKPQYHLTALPYLHFLRVIQHQIRKKTLVIKIRLKH